MEVQTLVVSESELNRLTSEAGLGTITFTTSDGLTIPIHHLDLTSATDHINNGDHVDVSTLSTSVADHLISAANQPGTVDIVVGGGHQSHYHATDRGEDQETSSVAGTITLDVAEMLMAAAAAAAGGGGDGGESSADDVIRLFRSTQDDCQQSVPLKEITDCMSDGEQLQATVHPGRHQQEINKKEPELNSEQLNVKSNDHIKDYQEFDDQIQIGDCLSRVSTMPDHQPQFTDVQYVAEGRGDQGSSNFDDAGRDGSHHRSSSCPAVVDDQLDDDDEGDVSSSMVVIDVSKPIHLSQNSLIVVNGQKCVLQQNRETGQLIAYPVREPEKPHKKRGRPKKSSIDKEEVVTVTCPPKQVSTDGQQHDLVECTAGDDGVVRMEEEEVEPKVKGLVEMANEAGEIVKRSARKRKKVVLEEYETGKIKILESDDDHEVEPAMTAKDKTYEDGVDVLPIRTSKRGSRNKKFRKATTSGLGLLAGEKSGRKRGRPRRYNPEVVSAVAATPKSISEDPPAAPSTSTTGAAADTHSFLIQMVDGQTIMMHLPITNIPDGVSVQNIAQSIADSLNTSISTSSNQKSELADAPLSVKSALKPPSLEVNSDPPPSVQPSSAVSVNPDSVDNFLSEIGVVTNSATTASQEIDVDLTAILSTTEPQAIQKDDQQQADREMPSVAANIHDGAETSKIVTSSTGATTVVPIPPNVLNVLIPSAASDIRNSPIRLGLKKSDDDLDKLHCSKCDFQAFYIRQFQDHLATHKDGIHKCKTCGHLSCTKAYLIEHVKNEHPKHICNVCNYTVSKPNMLKKHMRKHIKDTNAMATKDATSSTCETCGKTYKDPYILRIHIKNVHLPAEVIFECTLCGKKFTRKAHLKRHHKTHDPEMKQFKCELCSYRSFERADITKHQLIHQDPKYECEVCGKAFRHAKNKELHLKRHSGQRDYKCGVCDFYGYTFTDIRRHIERKHADPKTILCQTCGQAFKTDQLRKEHEASEQCELYRLEEVLQEPESPDMTIAVDLKETQPYADKDAEPDRLITDDTTTAILDLSSITLTKATDEQTGELVAAAAASSSEGDQFAILQQDCENGVQGDQQQQQFTMITVDGKVISSIISMDASEFREFIEQDEEDNS